MENKSKKLKLFISYCHEDESHIENFIKHIELLKNNGLIEDWYDRKILAGKDIKKEINNNLDDADIICLMISANFLSSKECKKEKEHAFELRKNKGIEIVPIIISDCGWKDDVNIVQILALPTDGKPIEKWDNQNRGWTNVYEGLKKVIEEINRIKQLKLSQEFENFLNDAEMLTNAHSDKKTVKLDDIFLYPHFAKYDNLHEYEKDINSEDVINEFCHSKIVIAGEEQSGKTVLCKMFFKQLRKNNFIPIYISDKEKNLSGLINNRMEKAFKEQYQPEDNIQIKQINKNRIVPIIDDFHHAKDKEKHINNLSVYPNTILIVDDIFALNIKDTKLIESFDYFKIKELNPTLRNELIKKWLSLSDKEPVEDNYQELDKKTAVVNQSLGKIIGSGVMPAYPFFVLNIINFHDTFNKPLEENITSQGYCYQTFIYIALRKQNLNSHHKCTT